MVCAVGGALVLAAGAGGVGGGILRHAQDEVLWHLRVVQGWPATGDIACAIRRRIGWRYSGLVSIPVARRPKFAAARKVVPLAAIGSIIKWRGLSRLG